MNTLPKYPDESQKANRDPITGAPGAHPVGTGLGAAAGGAAAGAAAGAFGGPVGAVAGAVVGGIAGGLAGKAIAEQIDPTVEDAYWRDNYLTRPYAETGMHYGEYQPAYRYGWESALLYPQRSFEETEAELGRNWEARRGSSKLSWDKARHAARDAWNRAFHRRANPGTESELID
jgi:hypothetical protein